MVTRLRHIEGVTWRGSKRPLHPLNAVANALPFQYDAETSVINHFRNYERKDAIMSHGIAVCLVCGEGLDYFNEARTLKCHICGKEELGHSVCKNNHYVCDACHRTGGVDFILEACKKETSKNPIFIAQKLMADKSIFPNGPEHHTLVGASLMCAYYNVGGVAARVGGAAGGSAGAAGGGRTGGNAGTPTAGGAGDTAGAGSEGLTLEEALAELRKRSLQVPGGTCGFWGTCGAATSAGQWWSIVSGSSPMTREPWAQVQRLTSRVLDKLADLGGPRCCKRTGFTAILESVKFAKEQTGIEMELPDAVTCAFYTRNAECLKDMCPYYPK